MLRVRPIPRCGFGQTCVRCERVFCDEHLTSALGRYLCLECENWRDAQRAAGSLFSSEEMRVVQLLLADLRLTVGKGYEDVLIEFAERAQLSALSVRDPRAFEDFLANDIQQYLHDTFADTSWPRCADHPNHPMWLSDSWWKCQQSGRRVAPLGYLAYRKR